MDTPEERFIEFERQTVHPELRAWYSPEQLDEQLGDAVRHAARRTADLAWAERRRDLHPVEGALIEDFLVREIDLGEGRRALAGMHFGKRGEHDPCALIRHRTFALDAIATLEALRNALAHAFSAFSPDRALVYVHDGSTEERPRLGDLQGVERQKRLLAGEIASLLDKPRPRHVQRVQVSAAESIDFYDAYRRMYDRLWEAAPAMRIIPVESRDDMQAYLEKGVVSLLEVDGEWAGVLAATRQIEHGLRGWRIEERVLDERHRGRGLGTAALRTFLESLPAQAGDVLYGRIHHTNAPSLRSAERFGRVTVGEYFWIDLHADPEVPSP